jgi:hypothetical protein
MPNENNNPNSCNHNTRLRKNDELKKKTRHPEIWQQTEISVKEIFDSIKEKIVDKKLVSAIENEFISLKPKH